jgi:hypothetical protein
MSRSVLLCLCVLLSGVAPRPGHADESFARNVPQTIGLFLEVREASDLLLPLTAPHVWTALAELAGQPARPQDVAEWRRQVRETIKMEPDQAIRVLFSKRVAFVGDALGRAQDAVVICRALPDVPVSGWLRLWQAEPEPESSDPAVYRLASNIGLAENKDLMLFGDLRPAEGIFRRIVRFNARREGDSLADDPSYRALLARVPADPSVIVFARLSGATSASRPSSAPAEWASGLPGPFRRSGAILLAMYRNGEQLRFRIVGDGGQVRRGSERRPLLETLPARTLAAWEEAIDFSAWLPAIDELPQRHALRVAVEAARRTTRLDAFLEVLEGRLCLAAGAVESAGREEGAPPAPAVALLLPTRDPGQSEREWRALVESALDVYALLAGARGLPPVDPPAPLDVHGRTGGWINLRPLVGPALGAALGEVHIAWIVDDGVLIIATHVDWLREIVAARQARSARIAADLSQSPISSWNQTLAVIDGRAIAELGAAWMRYLERKAPHVLQESWWRARQPGDGLRLGIDVVEEAEQHALRVIAVTARAPSDGLLEAGDRIIGCGSQRFASTQPIAEMRSALEHRSNARWVELLISRDGVELVRRIRLPFVDPIQLLDRTIALGQIMPRVVYHDDAGDPDGPCGVLSIELRGAAPASSRPAPGADNEPRSAPGSGNETPAPASQPPNTRTPAGH